MYKERAYVHWYERYDPDASSLFEEAFNSVEDVVQNYKDLLAC
jgi:hypothetical protein